MGEKMQEARQKVVRINLKLGLSTTRLIEKILTTYADKGLITAVDEAADPGAKGGRRLLARVIQEAGQSRRHDSTPAQFLWAMRTPPARGP
jgi:hypothetical protein